MANIIEITDLEKSFGTVRAVNKLSFKVKKGELFAFLGVNGAGKSTTISIICGLEKKDGGEVKVCEQNIDTNKSDIAKNIGVVFQNSALDPQLSVKDNLVVRASLYGIHGKNAEKRISELCEMLDFKDLLNRPLGKLSGGQKRKIDIARALLTKPKILILDEPTTGLDPQTRKKLSEVIDRCRKTENMTVFLTTHYMEEAADADYVVILDHGKISAEGTPLELKNKYTGDYVTIYNVKEEDIKQLDVPYEKIKDAFRLSVANTEQARNLILKHPSIFVDFEIIKGKMDDVFLAVTGKKLSGEN